MGPKKRRGRKPSLDDRIVLRDVSEATTLVTGDCGSNEAQVTPLVDGEELVAQMVPSVVSDRKLSSAVLVLENCLLTPSQQQPRTSFASSIAGEEVQQPTQPGRKRKTLGIRKRKAVVKEAQTDEGHTTVLCGSSEEILKPKQKMIKKQKREIARRIPRRQVNEQPLVAAAVIADEPTSDVDVETPVVGGDSCVEMEQNQTEKGPTVQENMLVLETFPEKRKRKRVNKKEKYSTKRKRKDDMMVAKLEEEQEQEIKVDDEEEEEDEADAEEGENCATWMVSPLSGDEERMIFKRQRKVLPPDSDASATTDQCLVPVFADVDEDLVTNVTDPVSSDNIVFADPMEADSQEDVESTCPVDDAVTNTNFTALRAGKGRRSKKKSNPKTALMDQPNSEIAMTVAEGSDVCVQKRTRLAKKNLKLPEVHEGQYLVAVQTSTESRVTRSRRNGSGNGSGNNGMTIPDDKQSLRSKKTSDETKLLPGSEACICAETGSLEGPASQETFPKGNFVKQTKEDEEEGKAAVEESKTKKKKKTKKKAKTEDLPSSTGSEEDRCSATSMRSSEADGDEMVGNALKDGIICTPVACQSFDEGPSECTRDAGETISSISDDVNITSTKSFISGTLCEKSEVSEPDKERSDLVSVIPAQQVDNDAIMSSGVCPKDGQDEASTDSVISVPTLKVKSTLEQTEKDKSLLSGTQVKCIQSEQCISACLSICIAKESRNTSLTNTEPEAVHSESASIVGNSTEEKTDSSLAQNTPVAAVLPSPFQSEVMFEDATKSDSDQLSVITNTELMSSTSASSNGVKTGDTVNVSMYTTALQGNAQDVIGTRSDSSKTEEAKAAEQESVDRDEENVLCLSSPSDANAKDSCPIASKKADQGIICTGNVDDTGYVPLKKRRLRMPETAAEATAAADCEKLVPGHVLTRTSDVPDPSCLLSSEISATGKTEGQQLDSTAPDILTSAVPSASLVSKANKYVGIHVLATGDLAGAVRRASQLGAHALGIFVKPQQTWTPPPLDPQEAIKFKEALKEKGYSPHMVVPHGSYLLNCGASDADHLSKSRESLVDDLKRCQMLGIPLFNFHPGAYSDSDTVDACVTRIADSINYAHSKVADVITVIENMSGEANSVGSTFAQLKQIIDRVVDKSRVGVCLDTCHAFAAGYNLCTEVGYRKMMEDFESTIGRPYLRAMHLNDSRGDLGSHVDHHESLGKGKIGLTCFQLIMCDRYLENIPLILETPLARQKEEIELLYSFASQAEQTCESHHVCQSLVD